MLDLGFEKLFVLLIVALFVLGPERLPAAAAWLGRAVRQVKSFAANVNQQVRADLGLELDELGRPLADLRNELRPLQALRNPRRAVLEHLLETPAATSDGSDARAKPVTEPRAATQPTSDQPHIDDEAT